MKSKLVYLLFSISLSIMIMVMITITFSSTASAINIEKTTSNGRIPIRWFVGLGTGTDPSQIDIEQQVVDDFNASQTSISLTLEVVPYDMAAQTLLNYLATGNSPDIIGPVGIEGAHPFKGHWLDLTPLISSTGYDLSDFNPVHIDVYTTADDGQISIPFLIFPSFIYYNKDLFDTAGLAYPPHEYGQPYTDTVYGGVWNVDKLSEIAKLLTLDSNTNNATEPGFDPDSIEQFGYFHQWTTARGEATSFGAGSFADAYGDAQIPSHWNTAFHWYYESIWGSQRFMLNRTEESSGFYGYTNVFNSGKLAMTRSHSWYICCLSDLAAGSWDIAAVPEYSGTIASKLDADSFYILKNTKHPDEAFEAYTYLIGTAVPTLLEPYRGFPARISQQDDAIGTLETNYPWVDWQVLLDSIPYADIPSYAGYLPNHYNAINRIDQFHNSYHNNGSLDINNEIDILQTDLQAIFHGGTQITATSGSSEFLNYYDVRGLNTLTQIPAGAVLTDTTLIYTPIPTITQPANLLFSGQAFNLSADQGSGPIPGFAFSAPITVTLFYDDDDVINIFEPSLGLYYWDGMGWSIDGIGIISRDVLNNRLTVSINHASLFAMFGEPESKVYIPLVMR